MFLFLSSVFCVFLTCVCFFFLWWSYGSLPSIRYTFSDFNVKLNLEIMLTGLTGIPFVPSNKVIMNFRHIYSEERSCLFMDHFILQSQGRNSELQIRIFPYLVARKFNKFAYPRGNFKFIILIAFLEIYLRLIVLSKTGNRGRDVCNIINRRLVKHEYFLQ
jgi:hypothetical protein